MTIPWMDMILRGGKPVASSEKMNRAARVASENFRNFMARGGHHGNN